jgi:DNA-binding IclR family transcriptional regulator
MTTIDKSVAILQQVADHGPRLHLAALQQLTNIPKPTLHRTLRTMQEHGLIRQDSAGTYSIGSHLFSLANHVYERVSVPPEVRQVMIDLQNQVRETIHVSAFRRGQLVYVEKLEAPHPFQMMSRVGRFQPLYCSAIGKAVLSQLSDAEARSLLFALDMPVTTDKTVVDPPAILDSLPALRMQGYAVDDEEDEAGLRGIGTSFCDRTGYPTGGVSIVAPAFQMSLSKAYGHVDKLIQATKDIERIMYPPTSDVAALGDPVMRSDPRSSAQGYSL